jgi:hypothetical protein
MIPRKVGRAREAFMRLLSMVIVIALLNVGGAVPGRGQARNTAPLRGGAPSGFIVLPPLPPNGFYAWCETPRGLCVVQGNAPIAPGSLCHCAEYAGRTG